MKTTTEKLNRCKYSAPKGNNKFHILYIHDNDNNHNNKHVIIVSLKCMVIFSIIKSTSNITTDWYYNISNLTYFSSNNNNKLISIRRFSLHFSERISASVRTLKIIVRAFFSSFFLCCIVFDRKSEMKKLLELWLNRITATYIENIKKRGSGME